MKTIALCFSTPDLYPTSWRRKEYGKKYPGAGWMKHLPPETVSGSMALELIKIGSHKPQDFAIVQEEDNYIGRTLIDLGSDPKVLTCLESPIFTPRFYDYAPSLKELFKHSILFDGGTEHLYFPSFDSEDIKTPKSWDSRKSLCMITSNKHYSILRDQYDNSPSFQTAMKTQLHDYRYQAIEHFKDKQGFDLYGRGWGDFAKECDDKLESLRQYNFCLCFENGSYPGYVTEKIIDCFVAGTIPIYVGPKDTLGLIATGGWIDPGGTDRGFEYVEGYMNSLTEPEAESIIACGREWLHKDGMKYSNEYFANRIMELCG